MTTKTLTGTYTSGYTLSASYSALDVAASAKVGADPASQGGVAVEISFAAPMLNNGEIVGIDGGDGVVLAAGGSVTNGTGVITGGAGGGGGKHSPGDYGGTGVELAMGGAVTNIGGAISGGAGGMGWTGTYQYQDGTGGGAGGAGITLAPFSILTNAATITGGAGGAGGPGDYVSGNHTYSYRYGNGGDGAVGGAGADLAQGGTLNNSGTIAGGAGGTGGSGFEFAGEGGGGGAGVVLGAGGSVGNSGSISGGASGGGGAYSFSGFEDFGGYGGAGILLTAAGSVTNTGSITGGMGGRYGVGGGGAGVDLAAGGWITNSGSITGGMGGAYDGNPPLDGGDSVDATGYATINNTGALLGGAGGPSGTGGAALVLRGGGSVINTGSMTGGMGGAAGRGTGVPGMQGDGVVLTTGGSVRNGVKTVPTAMISGLVGVDAVAGGTVTVTNFGTIVGTGGTAVLFGSAGDRLIAMAGSQLVGLAQGGGGTLELALGTGTITGLGAGGSVSGAMSMAFAGFTTYQLDGGTWTLAGGASLAAGQVLNAHGVAGSASTTLTGSLSNAGVVKGTTAAGMILSNATIANAGGTITAATGSKVLLEGATIAGGVVSSTSAGKIMTANGTSNTLDGSASAITLPALTSLTVADTTYLTVMGAIANSGKISLSAVTHTAELIIGGTGVTLSGGGSVTLSANAGNLIAGAIGVVLTNVDNKITGSGQIGGGSLVIVNQARGLIEQTGAVALNMATGSRTIVNAGTIEVAGAGGMTIKSAIANTGLLEAVKGNLTVMLAVTGTGSAIVNAATLDFASSFSENVKFSGATGVLELAKSTTYTGVITGFSKTGGTQLDLLDIGFKSGVTKATYAGNITSGILTVTDGVHIANINLTGNYTKSTFVVATDNHNGTLIQDPTATASPAGMASAMAGMSGPAAATSPWSVPTATGAPTLATPGSG